MRKMASIFSAILVLTIASISSADITIDGFTDETNDRFTNDPSFIGSGFDFSGVGRRNGWGTLISRNVIVTANHAAGTAPNEYRFYPGNDATATPEVRFESSRMRLVGDSGNSDLLLIALDAPVSSDIAHYNFASELISAPPYDADSNPGIFNAGSFQDEIAYVFGISETVRGDTRTDQAVGRNRVSGYIEEITFGDFSDSLLFARDMPGDADYVPFETLVQAGDSGAPVFIERNGELLLLGVNSFRSGADFSGINYIGNYADDINSFISASAVPEPSSLAILAVVGIASFVRRRRLV